MKNNKELRGKLASLAFGMDTQWCLMHGQDVGENTRIAAQGMYQGMIYALGVLGGDWKRDSKGKHRVFLQGESSRDTDEYTSEEA